LRRGLRQTGSSPEETRLGRFELRYMEQVVFTGEMNEVREIWEQRARAAGLVVGKFVTKKTALVVAGDPDSLSCKARQARDYKIRIITEGAFGRMLGAMRTQPEFSHDWQNVSARG
jgi:DNA polymerase III subunit epsilon